MLEHTNLFQTRRLAAEALSHNPLHATLLKQVLPNEMELSQLFYFFQGQFFEGNYTDINLSQVFLFELQAAHDAVQKKQLAQWSFNYATEKGIQLKI